MVVCNSRIDLNQTRERPGQVGYYSASQAAPVQIHSETGGRDPTTPFADLSDAAIQKSLRIGIANLISALNPDRDQGKQL